MPRATALLALLFAAGPAAAQPPVRLDFDHTDLAAEYVGGGWRGQIRNVAGAAAYAPDRAVLVANPSSVTGRPGGAAFDFIGVPAATRIWRLNQNQLSTQLYLGVSSERMPLNGGPGAYVSWTRPGTAQTGRLNALQVTAVRAPAGGQFAVWQDTLAGTPDVFVSTALRGAANPRAAAGNGFAPSPNTIYGLIGSHAHYNWAFTAAGRYEVDVVPLTYTAGPTPLTLADADPPFTFVFDVVSDAPAPAPVTVAGVRVNDATVGATQRSRVLSLTVTFSGPTTPAAGAFRLTRVQLAGGAAGDGAVITSAAGGQVTAAPVAGTNSVRLTFTGGGPVDFTSLGDGVWRLDVLAAGVPGLAADFSTPTDQGNLGARIFRLFGDLTGDGVVDGLDAGPFDNALNTAAGGPGYLLAADRNDDGVVDGLDAGPFDNALNTGIDG